MMPVSNTDTDRELIARIVADVETAFNTKDPELAVRHFTDDATVINALGARVSGRDALLAAHESAFRGFLADEYARYELAEVRFLRDDVAVATKLARTADSDGALLGEDPAMVAQYVLVRDDGQWRVSARANVLTQAI